MTCNRSIGRLYFFRIYCAILWFMIQTHSSKSKFLSIIFALLTDLLLYRLQGLTSTEQSLQMNLYSRAAGGGSEQDPFSSDLCLHKNPLFSQELPTSQLVLLQQRAETVRDNLAAIQANDIDVSSPVLDDSTSLFPKGQLVDTVRVHLSQVQRTLAVKLAHSLPELSPSKDYSRSSKSSCQVRASVLYQEVVA